MFGLSSYTDVRPDPLCLVIQEGELRSSLLLTALKKGTVLFTLYAYGPSPGNYFTGSPTVLKGGSAQGYNDSVQVAHSGNTRNARPMRTQVQAFVVKEDICVAKGTSLANPHLGTGGGIQYFIEDGDKPKLTSGPIMKFSK